MHNKEVVILGGGLGVLFSAALLVKEGVKVTVIEKNPILGGGMQSFCRHNAVFDTDMHVITSMVKGGSVYRLCQYLGILEEIYLENIEQGNSDTIYVKEDNKFYTISAGKEGFIQSLLSYFPNDESDIQAYIQALEDITDEMDLFALRSSRQISFLQNEDFFMPVELFIAKYIRNEKLRHLLVYMNILYSGESGVTPAYLHAVIAVLLMKGVSRFKGGTYRFVDTLTRFIKKHGGILLLGDAVSEVVVESHQVQCVRTTSGREVKADMYISSIHPASLLDLLSDKSAVSKPYYSLLQEFEDSQSAFIINIKFKEGTFPYLRHTGYYYDCYHSAWELNCSSKITKFMYLTPPVLEQGEFAHTICITLPISWKEVEQWEDSKVGRRSPDYYIWKKQLVEIVIEKMENLYPSFRECIEFIDAASPLTIRDYTGVRHGAMCGYKKNVNNLITNHLPVKTRVSNLLLTGQNVNIHGFCGVILTALQTCEEILGANHIIQQLNAMD